MPSRNKVEVEITAKDQASPAFKDVTKAAGGFKSAMGTIGAAVGGLMGGMAIAGIAGQIKELASASAAIPGVAATFRNLGGSIEAMREGSLGMTTDIDLMKSFNQAAQLVSVDFAQKLPNAMQYLSKVSAATGQDMGYMIDSLVKGVGRMSPMILDNLGIQVNLTESNEKYAASLGKSADQLTKAEQQTGMMNTVLEKLAANTAAMPDMMGSAAQQTASFGTAMANMRNELGQALVPVLQEIQTAMVPVIEHFRALFANEEFQQGIANLAKFLGDLVTKLLDIDPVAIKVGLAIVTLGMALPQLVSGFAAVKAAVLGLNAVLMANPLGLIAAGIIAAGLGIAAIIDRVKKSNDEYLASVATADEKIRASSTTYEEYTARMVEMLRVKNELPATYTNEMILLNAVNDGLIKTRDEWTSTNAVLSLSSGALQGLNEGLLSVGAGMSAAKAASDEWQAGLAVVANETLPAVVQGFANFRQVAGEEFYGAMQQLSVKMSEFFRSDDLTKSLNELSAAYGQHMANMQKITEDGVAKQQEAQFQHNLKMVQSEAEYQGQRAALVAAGNAKAVADLDAKFQAENATAAANYAQQTALEERALLAQRITEQQSYIASLEMQQKAMQLKLIAMVQEAGVAVDTKVNEQQTLLDIILMGANEQVRAEVDKSLKLAQVQKELASNSISTAATTVESLMAIYQGDIAAAKAGLADLQSQFSAMSSSVLAQTQASFTQIGFNAGVSVGDGLSKGVKAGAKAAKKPVTEALADVAQDVASGIDAAKKAMESLPDMIFTADMERGLDEMGKLLKTATKKAFEWLQEPSMKSMLNDVQDSADEIMAVFEMLSVDLSKVIPQGSRFFEQADVWISQFKGMMDRLLKMFSEVTAEDKKLLPDAEELAGQFKGMFDVLGVDLEPKVAKGDFIAKADLWVKQFRALGGRIYTQLMATKEEHRKGLAEAGQLARQFKELFSIFEIDLAKAVPRGEDDWLEKVEKWLKQFRAMGGRVYDLLNKTLQEHRENLPGLAKLAASFKEMFGIFEIDLAKAVPNEELTWLSDLEQWIVQFRATGGRLYDMLADVLPLHREMLPELAALVDDFKKIFELLSIKITIQSLPDMSQLNDWVFEVVGTASYLVMLLGMYRPGWSQEAYDNAEALVANVKKILDVLSLGLQAVTLPTAGWNDQLNDWVREIVGTASYLVMLLGMYRPGWSQQAWDDASTLAQNVKKVLELLSITFDIKLPGPGLAQRVLAFTDNLKIALDQVLIALGEIAVDLAPEAAAAQAEFANSIGGILDILRLGDLFQEMTEVEYSDSVVALVPFRFAVTKIVEDMRWAIGYLVPRLEALKGEWETGLANVKSIAELIASVFEALASATSSANTLLEEGALSPENLTAALNAYAAAAQTVSDFAMAGGAVPGTPGNGAAETPRLSGTVMLHVIRDDTGEDYVTELELAQTIDELLAELWVTA